MTHGRTSIGAFLMGAPALYLGLYVDETQKGQGYTP